MLTRRSVLLAIVLAVAHPLCVAAQGLENSELQGIVRDATAGVINGAEVSLTGDRLIGGARTVLTDERGAYRFSGLLPGNYEIALAPAGFKRTVRRNIVLPLATTLTIDIVVEVASLNQSIEVAGGLIDISSPAIVTNLDAAILQQLPVRRHPGEILALAPGIVSPSVVSGLVTAYGGTLGSNGFYFDGVDATEPRRQSLWLPINYNWIDQVQIVGPAAGVEYGEFTGAVGNAVFKSGGNRFSGLAEYWTTRWSWIDRNGSSLAGREIVGWWDSTLQAGGPLRRDRLWFFTGLERYRRDDRPLNYTARNASERTSRLLAKVTTALSSSARLEGYVQRNWYTRSAANAGPNTSLDALSDIDQSDASWNLRLTRPLGADSLIVIRSGGYSGDMREEPRPPNSLAAPAHTIDFPTQFLSGNSATYQRAAPSQVNSGVTITHRIANLAGSHQIDAGGEYKWTESLVATGYPGGRRISTQSGVPFRIQVWEGDRTRADGRRTTLHVQDRWAPVDRLSVSAGIRVDFNRGSVPAGNVFSTNPLSPRVGIVWAFQGGRTALKAHGGRYQDAMLTERVAFMDAPGISPFIVYRIGPAGETVETGRTVPGDRAIDPDIKHSYVDQYMLGLEHELLRNVLAQAHYIRRNFDRFMAMIDVGPEWIPTEVRDPGPDNRLNTSDDGGVITAYRSPTFAPVSLLYTNPPDAYRRYEALQLVVARRWSRDWQLQASYTFSKTKGTAGNGDFVNAGLNDTGDLIAGGTPGVFMNPNGRINADGPARHGTRELKLLGAHRTPAFGGVLLSGIVRHFEGYRWERSVTYFDTLIPGNFQQIRVEPRGSRQGPAVWNLDFRVEKPVRLRRTTLGVAFDVFNATNQGTPLAFNGGSGPSFGAVLTRSDPRMLRVVVRAQF
jgi:hypothetical protein